MNVLNREDYDISTSCVKARVEAVKWLGITILWLVISHLTWSFKVYEGYKDTTVKSRVIVALDITLSLILYFPIMATKIVQVALAVLIHPVITFKPPKSH